jgi:hypothetical protein
MSESKKPPMRFFMPKDKDDEMRYYLFTVAVSAYITFGSTLERELRFSDPLCVMGNLEPEEIYTGPSWVMENFDKALEASLEANFLNMEAINAFYNPNNEKGEMEVVAIKAIPNLAPFFSFEKGSP